MEQIATWDFFVVLSSTGPRQLPNENPKKSHNRNIEKNVAIETRLVIFMKCQCFARNFANYTRRNLKSSANSKHKLSHKLIHISSTLDKPGYHGNVFLAFFKKLPHVLNCSKLKRHLRHHCQNIIFYDVTIGMWRHDVVTQAMREVKILKNIAVLYQYYITFRLLL